jgi:hypothetical protein
VSSDWHIWCSSAAPEVHVDTPDDDISIPYGLPGFSSGPSIGVQGFGLAAALVPFVCHWTQSETVNGEITFYLDYVALTGAVLAIPIGLYGLVRGLRAPKNKGRILGMGGAALLLGLVQLALAFGALARL